MVYNGKNKKKMNTSDDASLRWAYKIQILKSDTNYPCIHYDHKL